MELKRESDSICIIPKQGRMHVPGKIYLSRELEKSIDAGSIEQVKSVAALPGIVGESIAMPDIHIGYGFPIGGVAAFDAEKGIISPGGIGFDINCGVRMLTTDLTREQVEPLAEELLKLLARAVPTGTGRDSSIHLSHEELDNVLQRGSAWTLEKGYATSEDIENTEERGCLRDADPAAVSHRAKDRGVNQLGTLGAGNHFLEVQIVDKLFDAEKASAFDLREGQVVVMIHCGSRGLGHQVCSDYLQRMEEEYPDVIRALPEKNLAYAPLASKLGQDYWKAMAAAANFAWVNRQVITYYTRKTFQRLFPGCSVKLLYDVSHNIAKKEHYSVKSEEKLLCVHRKGATRAFPPGHPTLPSAYKQHGQPVLIPGSMGTTSYVLAGTEKSMIETFGSTCHGAGRQLSRHSALKSFQADRLRSELKAQGIIIKAGSSKGLVEEAPAAYKDVDEVIKTVAAAGLSVPVARCVPRGVLKG